MLPCCEGLVANCCVTPEVLITPAPLIVIKCPLGSIENGLAPEAKTTLFTSTDAETVIAVMLEVVNVATSSGPLGTVAGVQLAAVFQSPLVGVALQVALPANEWAAINSENRQIMGK